MVAMFMQLDPGLKLASLIFPSALDTGWGLYRKAEMSDLGKDERSLSRYSPSAFWIFPSRSASLSSDLWTPWMFRTSMTRGDLVTFFIRARNSMLMLWNQTSHMLNHESHAFFSTSVWSIKSASRWPLEALRLHRKQVFDVCASCENAFQVNPSALHVDPDVKQSHDAVEFVLPAQSVLLEHLPRTETSHRGTFLSNTQLLSFGSVPCSRARASWQTRCWYAPWLYWTDRPILESGDTCSDSWRGRARTSSTLHESAVKRKLWTHIFKQHHVFYQM